MRRLSKFLRLPRKKQFLLMEAIGFLGVAKIATKAIPFRWLSLYLGKKIEARSLERTLVGNPELEAIAWSLRIASRNLFWKAPCLVQAIAGQQMLRCRGWSSILSIGIPKEKRGEFSAHAWLQSEQYVVTGDEELDSYIVIACFERRDANR